MDNRSARCRELADQNRLASGTSLRIHRRAARTLGIGCANAPSFASPRAASRGERDVAGASTTNRQRVRRTRAARRSRRRQGWGGGPSRGHDHNTGRQASQARRNAVTRQGKQKETSWRSEGGTTHRTAEGRRASTRARGTSRGGNGGDGTKATAAGRRRDHAVTGERRHTAATAVNPG